MLITPWFIFICLRASGISRPLKLSALACIQCKHATIVQPR
jgi:hypothetical protein